MKWSVGITLLVVLVGVASAYFEETTQDEHNKTSNVVRSRVRLHTLDRECAMVGGICVNVDDCDPDYLSTTKGLCPSNKQNGVECCYRYKRREDNTCDDYQGTCMSYCHPLIRHKTNDCGDRWCCTLV